MSCNSSSPFVKVSKKYQKSVTQDFEIFPGGNGSVRLAVIIGDLRRTVLGQGRKAVGPPGG